MCVAHTHHTPASAHSLFALPQGGFGALLRGAGKGGRITNDDACRDLSGRRLRDVNAEKKLKEWAAGAKERELEKVAERHIREKAGAAARAADATRAAEESLQREHAAIVGQLSTAVRSGLSQAEEQSQLAKRKAEQQRAAVPSKKACFWTLDSEIGREALSDDEDEQPGQQAVTAPVVPEPQPEAPPPPPHAAAPVEAAVEEEAHPQPPIDLAQFSTAAELEALGLDRLKVELTTRGLKCGGTLAERAARLFLLNTVAYDALDAKHKAKGR